MAKKNDPTRQRPPGPLAQPLILGVRFYQATLGAVLGGHCRFIPTCSVFAIDALNAHGAVKGSWLALRRILRCHPFGGGGYDPVREQDQRGSGSGVRGSGKQRSSTPEP
ncbi:MAG: membrane protein insertion efficiency factor YidD [Planctomycetes bacterium]|nr:membrane protein insertion efficiency factor YidD [Planctomycetota bacterium]